MKQNKETLKQFFETGDKPTQEQYSDLIDSYIDAKQPEGEANRRFVIDETGEVSIASEQQAPEYTLSPISGTNTVDLLKGGVSVSQIDLTPYLDNTNLARLVSGTVDANGLATFTRDDNSTFTVDLSNLKDTVPQYQAGTNISIDTTDPLQPIINATAGSGGATDLSYDAATRKVASSTGTDAVIPLADATNAGLQKANFYEEGAFTPVLGGGTYTNGSTTGSSYVRIGNLVHLYLQIQNINGTGSTLDLNIGGMPFPASASGYWISSNMTLFNGSNYANPDKLLVDFNVGSGTLRFRELNGSYIENVNFSNGEVRLNITYRTNIYTP
ncbi:hypothetical protein [Tenacibaculum mesophilum]|uniref:hypothetical protein n=1 Tax=Tenacibaculum mesophilum TaxID=104268 RepID=UPI0024921189|nr:hypothetical protein [Tenacibaculum mesophilum]